MAPPPTCALLIDLSGTIQIGAHATPGAAAAIERLRAAHIPFRFCSNTSNESTHALLERLHNLGIDVRADELWTSLRAVGAALRSRQCSRPFVVATEPAKEEILASIGAPPPPLHEIPPSIGAPAPADTPHADYDAVVLAYAPAHYDFHTLNTAFRVLMHELPAQADTAHAPPLPLFATHASRYVQAADGRLSLGPGPFVAALEMGAGVRAQVVGKPERAFFEMALRSFDFVPGAEEGRIVMVGDDVREDLGGRADMVVPEAARHIERRGSRSKYRERANAACALARIRIRASESSACMHSRASFFATNVVDHFWSACDVFHARGATLRTTYAEAEILATLEWNMSSFAPHPPILRHVGFADEDNPQVRTVAKNLEIECIARPSPLPIAAMSGCLA